MTGTAGVIDVALAGAVLVVAVAAVALPRRPAAVTAFLVFGILLAVLWARLGAPDVALAEAALGGGVAGALLVDALSSPPAPGVRRRSGWLVGAAALAGAVVVGTLVAIVRTLPDSAGPVPALVDQEIGESGATHPITAVLLNFRSYDTLLEIAVLVVVVVAASGVAHGTAPVLGPPPPVLHALAVLLLPVLVLLAGWLLVAGTTRPGGAFQAGAVLGAALVVAHLAGVRGVDLGGTTAAALVAGGLLVFVALAFGTAVAGGGWLVLSPSWAGAAILAVETALTVSIGIALARLFVVNRRGARFGGGAS